MGEWGVDEGGILESVSKPFHTEVTETFKYGRKGSAHEGLVTEHVTKTKSYSVADVMVILLAAGIVSFGKTAMDYANENPEYVFGAPFGLMGLLAAAIYDKAESEDAGGEGSDWSLWDIFDALNRHG